MPPVDVFFSKLGTYIELTQQDISVLQSFAERTHEYVEGQDILVQGEPSETVYLIQQGWAIRYKLLSDGRRQVLTFLLPGDLFGFKECLFDFSDDSVQALTNLVVHPVAASKITELPDNNPRLALALTWARLREQSILGEQIVRLGRRSAYERMAHLIMELLHRLQLVDLASESDFWLPLTHEILADTLGLSTVHINRTLRRLRDDGLVSIDRKKRILRILDINGLARAGGYDDMFLDQKTEPAKNISDAITST